MQKIPFENLPSTNYPVSASNLNQLQTNVENSFKGTNTTSDSDTYNCNYINENLPIKTSTAKCYRVTTAGTYRIVNSNYRPFLMYGICNTMHFFCYCCFSGSSVVKKFIDSSQPSLQFTQISLTTWDFTLPNNSDLDIVGWNGLTVTRIS